MADVINKYRDEAWDFAGANTKQYTHVFHNYPAMMIPQVAGKILDIYGKDASWLFDPYCGTGTSLVEASVRGISAIGTDINPLARLIAKVKTTPIDVGVIDEYISKFHSYIYEIKMGRNIDIAIPQFDNIHYWFKEETITWLTILKHFIETVKNADVRDFFLVAFSETVRDVSLTRKGEFKLYRMSEAKIERWNPDVAHVFMTKLVRNREGMREYLSLRSGNVRVYVYDFDTVYGIPYSSLPTDKVDIVVTSPPYGDSRTTVAYGQFSRLSNQWLGFEDKNNVDKRSMGGQRVKEYITFNIPLIDDIILSIWHRDKRRAYDVMAFYRDYQRSISNIARLVRPGGIVAYVVGNRTVKGINIPNDEITKVLFEDCGFEHVETIIRAIPSKRMPRKNSPSNIKGMTGATMNYEYIVVLRKIIDRT